MRDRYTVLVFVAVLVSCVMISCRIFDPPSPPPVPSPPDQVTLIYEVRDGPPSREIQAALRQLNEAGIRSSAIDQHVVDGDGNIPVRYYAALSAVSSVPSLVIERGDEIEVIVNPTESDVLELLP